MTSHSFQILRPDALEEKFLMRGVLIRDRNLDGTRNRGHEIAFRVARSRDINLQSKWNYVPGGD
jgi:hypothetical protein